MSHPPPQSPGTSRSVVRGFTTLLLAFNLFLGLWLGAQALTAAPPTTTDTVVHSERVEPWPTVPPPISRQSASNPLLMPTPVPMPRWEDRRELGIGSFTLTSVQAAEAHAGRPWPRDKTVHLLLTYEIDMYVDLSGLSPDKVQRDGNTIAVEIPPPVWKLPELSGIRSLEPEQHSTLFPNSPPAQVFARGVADVVRQLEDNPGLRQLAYDAARAQMTAFLKDLGFRQVTVTISQ